jgi:hypothetical protein
MKRGKDANGVTGTASVASIYRHFDLETLAKGIAAIPVPAKNPITNSMPIRR